MSLGDTFESDVLLLVFQNVSAALVGDSTGLVGSTVAGSLYVALHTANPGETGVQNTSECTWGAYARVAVARTSGGWTKSGTAPTQVANTAAVTFPACISGSESATYFSVGTASSSTGKILFYGALTAPLAISTGITPSFAIGALICSQD